MNKLSLLAASVAIALTGCGGSDSSSNGGSNGIVITGFDGYFKNAVVFEDLNNNGQWDSSDKFLGLTDEKGQLQLDVKPATTLALQTITPNGAKQKQLIALDPKHAGTYTVDMDHPSQAMAHEVVFRAPKSSDVISPLTDLVAIEMANDPSVTEEQAAAKVNLALGGTEDAPIDLYSDFVSGADKSAELHKTAQILTESKAQNPANYEKKATEFAQQAEAIVGEMTPEQVADLNNKPVIEDATPDSNELSPVPVFNTKLVVNESVEDAAKDKLENLPEIVKGAAFAGVELNIDGLFKDKDQNLVTPKLTHNLKDTGIEVSLTGNQLILSPAATVDQAGEFEIVLTAEDQDSAGKVLSTVSVVFKLEIDSANQAPVVIEAEQQRLQAIIDGWQLQQGEAFEQTLDISGLFKDEDGQITDYSADYVEVEGLAITENDNAIITIKGTPADAHEAGQPFAISVKDDQGAAVQMAFSLPEIKAGATPPPAAHPLEGKTWYYLESGSYDGNSNDELNYSRVWCESIKFENGIVYGNERNLANRTNCSDADTQMEQATYEINDGHLIATFHFEEDGKQFTETFAVEVAGDADKISQGAKTIVHRAIEAEEPETERYTYFADKSDAENRVQVKSDDGYDQRFGYIYLPGEQENTWDLGMVSFALTEKAQGGYSAYINFDVEGKDFTCDTVNEFYEWFTFTGDDITPQGQQNWYPISSCNTYAEDGVKYANIYFDLSQVNSLTEGTIYSFIGTTKAENAEYVEAVKFNMEWTGTGDNE
ncbi:hypothetical protein [Vibrio sp. CAU 1672]|uniref:hypothetical protein n=1 Tax=Vibrio sp. CAU 1672 TaxID=3032594 RepID=UPI0023DAEDAA|nr:hypothetical protein [Vibrio sp. CAU 1672]MDF2154053.1 hypothetical protein [Vibrio sp. CAU 1672]